ncbi:MAG: biopolymer transporter ExbD [Planctomycetota bacterium]|nr:biopolymer transporter ExbD [Planctomycetota bacterium]
MAIQFNCNQCKQTLSVDDRHAGAKIRCPKCGAISAAPGGTQAPPQAAGTEHKKAKPSKAVDLDSFEEVEPIRFAKKKSGDEEELDMTPMVDVTFLLLIFFMVTAAFSMQKSLEVPTPDEDKASTQQRIVDPEDGNIVVRIDQDSTIWVNESEAPSEQDLLVKLREAKQGSPGSDSPPINSLLVMADGDARHEVVIMVLDAGNSVQMEPIRLVTVEDGDF